MNLFICGKINFQTENTFMAISNDSILYFKWMNHFWSAVEGFLFSIIYFATKRHLYAFHQFHACTPSLVSLTYVIIT